MTARWTWPTAMLVALAGVGGVAAADRSPAGAGAQPEASRLPVQQVAYVCPAADGTDAAPTTVTVVTAPGGSTAATGSPTRVETSVLAGAHTRTTAVAAHRVVRIRRTTATPALVVTAHGPAAARVVADEQRMVSAGGGRGLRSTGCAAPGTDWWLTGPDGRVSVRDTLVLANPGGTVANVTVRGWSTSGPFAPPKLQAFTISPQQAVALPVSTYAPDRSTVAFHVHANSGRVTAAVSDRRVSGLSAQGSDWIPPTAPPGRHLVLPGFSSGPGVRRLLVANPGSVDATVGIRLVTGSGDFAPAGVADLVVRAGHTTSVDLTRSFAGVRGAVVVASDHPVVATGRRLVTGARGSHPDVAWLPAAQPLGAAAVLPQNRPPFGSSVALQLTAPGSAATVRVTTVTGRSRVLAVHAGRTLRLDPGAAFGAAGFGPLVLSHVSGGPAYAARSLFAAGAHGPLFSSEQPIPLPGPVPLPPVSADPRAAVR